MDKEPLLSKLENDIFGRGFDVKKVSGVRDLDKIKENKSGVFLETNKHLIGHGEYDKRYFDIRIRPLPNLDQPMLWEQYDSEDPSHVDKLSQLLEIDIAINVLWPIKDVKRFRDLPISIFYNNEVTLPAINQLLERYNFPRVC
ncbi:hypothetical protein K9L16_00835 [Candidatus Pacearchaeota archaeon]|nr:hypothetical protein [Candidatus Pacearchaeota archaeon]